RLPAEHRCRSAEELCGALRARSEVTTHAYSTMGLRAGIDILLWSLAPSLEALEEKAAGVLRSDMGTWMTARQSFLGVIRPSQYVKRPTPQEQSLFSGEGAEYLRVYSLSEHTD